MKLYTVFILFLLQMPHTFAAEQSQLTKVIGSINDKRLNAEYESIKNHIKIQPKSPKAYLFKAKTKIRTYTRKGIKAEYYNKY